MELVHTQNVPEELLARVEQYASKPHKRPAYPEDSNIILGSSCRYRDYKGTAIVHINFGTNTCRNAKKWAKVFVD